MRTAGLLRFSRAAFVLASSCRGPVVAVPGCDGLTLDLGALGLRVGEIVEEEPDEEPG